MFLRTFLAGLKWWLFFVFCLILLGYPIPWSIFLGTLGGFAGGIIARYSQIIEVQVSSSGNMFGWLFKSNKSQPLRSRGKSGKKMKNTFK